jgi:hypothetical protein
MQLHRGQLAALNSFADSLEVKQGRLPIIAGNDYLDAFRAQILDASHWKTIIGRHEFFEIVLGTVYKCLSKLSEIYSGPLSEANDGAILGAVKAELQTAFESLPRSYDLFIPLDSLQVIHQTEITLSEEISLVDSAEHPLLGPYLAPVPVQTLSGLLGGIRQTQLPPNGRRFLRVRTTGFGSDMPNSPAIRDAWAIAKRLAFIGIASGNLVVKQDWIFRLNANAAINPAILAELWQDNALTALNSDFEILRFFSSLAIKEPITVADLTGKSASTLLTAPDREAVTPEDFARAIRLRMGPVTSFLAVNTEDAAPVRAAMEWFIDADASQNETVAFLQRCIGLEAILGSSESRRDVTERLADRYAYLVCTTASARNVQRTRFIAMYKHRSEIIHGRSTKLSEEHRRASWDARDMLVQVVWREMRNVLEGAAI